MSFGAGGLAQMTYNNLNGNMGLPNNGLSSRGANMKRLTISAPSPNDEVAQAPKSSRAQLLSGLRTQKNNATIPGTAPATQTHFSGVRKPSPPAEANHLAVPQTATAASFGQNNQSLNVPGVGPRGHHYTPSQVLSPPSITLESEEADGQVDPSYYQELVRMNQHLAQQQERLKQQLVAVTQQAQQMGLNPQQAQYYAQMMAQQAGLYSQQVQMPQQQLVEAVPGQPGLFIITNPVTGQQQYYFDQNSAAQQMAYGMDLNYNDQNLSHSPPPATPTYNKSFEPATNNHAKSNNWRSVSPPKHTATPPTDEPVALPPQGANAWRPGHKKTSSLMPTSTPTVAEAPKPAPVQQGNFGPGQNREGEHPIRQPRGPPSLDELTAKPTAKHEGSKNFASRQRRAALNNIISAGAARRSYGSQASSPTSERDELVFSSSAEDNDTASIRSGGSTQRAIGSEKKEREERESRERERKNSFEIETKSVSSEEGLVDVQSRMGAMGLDNKEKRRSAILGLKGAGQRRSMMF